MRAIKADAVAATGELKLACSVNLSFAAVTSVTVGRVSRATIYKAAVSSGYIHEVENGNNAVFGNNDDRAVLVDCVIGVFQLWHSLRQNCRKF